MTQILGTNRQSKCMYCGSTAYGTGCPYSPHKKHVHSDDPKRCIYCGSTSFGVGCPYNPFSRKHVHGVEFNQMMKESIFTSFTISAIIARLNQPITEMSAYKLKLIDEHGNKLRTPETIEEKNAFTTVDAYLLKLRRMVGEEKIKLLNTTTVVEMLSRQVEQEPFNQELYEKEIKIKQRIDNFLKEYKDIVVDSTQQGFSNTVIENMFIETLLENL